jgi:predicted MFS family arabinose efflux permease
VSARSAWGRYAALWLPQTLAMTGAGMTTFALGVWVYQRTHSATLFALLEVSAMLPGVVAAPIIGWAVDRLGPRRALLLADGAAVAIAAALVLLFRQGAASPPLLYALLSAGGLLMALQWPAYTALVTVLAPPEHLPRAAALMNLGYGGQQVVAPALGGLLLGAIGVGGVVGIDLATAALAFTSLWFLPGRMPAARRGAALGADLRAAWRLIADGGLLRLALYIVVSYFPGGMVLVLATPLVLTLAGPETLGAVLSVMGLGLLAGGIASSALARPRGGVRRLLRYDALLALAMLAVLAATRVQLIAAAGFLFLFGLAGVMAEEQAIWQTRIPVEAQGRVFALRRAITWISLPVSYAVAGPLADHVFKPAMSEGGALAPWLGPLLGVGPGRGIALLLACGGLVKGTIVLRGAFDPRLRELDAAAVAAEQPLPS